MRLYLDIETIPSQSADVHAAIAASIEPPGNISKPETIAKWHAETKPGLVTEAIARTALDGSVGHICAIGWAWDDEQVNVQSIQSVEDERNSFANVCGAWISRGPGVFNAVTVIGHNVVNFDIRFLWQRAIILGVTMPEWFPRDPKPWGSDTFDTMTAFAGQRGSIGLERLCVALGMPGKGDIDGSKVGGLWAAGEHDKIASYCGEDVKRTRAVHRRMLVAYGEAA